MNPANSRPTITSRLSMSGWLYRRIELLTQSENASEKRGLAPCSNHSEPPQKATHGACPPFSRKAAVIEYNGRGLGYESVWVNGVLVAKTRASKFWSFSAVVPKIEFEFQRGQVWVPAQIEVHVTPWITVSRFRLTIAGELAYIEGNWLG